jgi:hypothetical protein
MTKAILARLANVLLPRVGGALRHDIWQPHATLTALDGFDLWYGTLAFTGARPRHESRRCCSDFPR